MPENIPESLQLKIGENYVLRLRGLATSGYEWICTVENDKVVAVKKEFEPTAQTAKHLAGASANEIFTITGLQQGNTRLHFKQIRSWEPGNAVKEKKITITVT
jgi:predicted secreted protein